jgi:CelD/BcsL family acetyltransferase involved in cellulose biosynthesis
VETVVPDSSSTGVRLITSPDEFMLLRNNWNALAVSSAIGSLFCTHEWFDAAWQWRQQSARLYLLANFVGLRLAAVLPLVLSEIPSRGLTVRELSFLTVPDTQACDMLAAEQDSGSACTAFVTELARRRGEWDVIRLKYLTPRSVAASVLWKAFERNGFTTKVFAVPGNPFIAIDTSWVDYYATRSRRLKKANNLAANRAKKAGDLRVEWVAPGRSDPLGVDRLLAQAIAISGKSWKSRTGNSLDNAGPQLFIRRLSDLAAQRGWLSIWILNANNRPIAMEYQLIADGNVYGLRSDFDAEFESASPGTYLSRHLLERLFELGLRRYYMGPGNNAYKHHWTEEVEPVRELTVYGRSITGKCLAAWETAVKPAAIKVLGRLRAPANDELSRA